jgi:fructokinase
VTRRRIGIDLGGTKIEGVVLGDHPTVPLLRKRIATPRGQGYEAILDAIVGLARECIVAAGASTDPAGASSTPAPDMSIGIGIPGILSNTHGRVKNANTTELIGRALGVDLERAIGRPILVENDANCFALAEALHGAGRGARCVFGVILGTGVGGGIIFDGQIWSGAQGIAGEWGHMTLDPSGPPCYCGRRGCVETFLSGPGTARFYTQSGGAECKGEEVWTRAAAGEPLASRAIEEYRARFGFALSQVVNLLDPDVIVLGGGVSKAPGLAEDAPALMRPHLFNGEVRTVVRRHELGDSAGVLGAAWLGATDCS